MRHPPAAGGPNQVGDCQAVPPGGRPDHAAHGGALSPAEAVAGSVIPGSADRGHRHHQPARQSRRERGLKTGAGDRVDPQGGHEDRPDGGCRIEQMGQHPLGIPGGDLLDSVDDDQTRRDKLVVQPVDRVLRKGHGQIAEKRSSVPHHRRRGLPGQGGMAVLHEPFRQEPGLSRSRRSHDDHRAIAAAAGHAIATHACSHDSKGMLHESLRPSRAGLCRGQRGGDDGRHWQRPDGERGLRAVHKNGVRLPRHSPPQQGSPKNPLHLHRTQVPVGSVSVQTPEVPRQSDDILGHTPSTRSSLQTSSGATGRWQGKDDRRALGERWHDREMTGNRPVFHSLQIVRPRRQSSV